jgi:hypothetical protein
VIDETVRPEDVEGSVLVRMRPAFGVPLFTDDGGVTVGVKKEPIVGRWQDISKDLAPDLRRYA